MSNKEQQECLDVVTLVNTLKNNNNDDGNNTVNDMEDNNLSLMPFVVIRMGKAMILTHPYGVVNVSMKIHMHIYHIVNINFQLINILISCPIYVVVHGIHQVSQSPLWKGQGGSFTYISLEVYSPSWPLSNRDYDVPEK